MFDQPGVYGTLFSFCELERLTQSSLLLFSGVGLTSGTVCVCFGSVRCFQGKGASVCRSSQIQELVAAQFYGKSLSTVGSDILQYIGGAELGESVVDLSFH